MSLATRSATSVAGLFLLLLLFGSGAPGRALDLGSLIGSSLGPAPRTEAGRFDNFAGELKHGTASVRLPFMLRRIRGFFSDRPGAPTPVAFASERRIELSAKSSSTVTWIGHATMLVQLGGSTFLTDPTWSETASPIASVGPRRFVAPGIDFDALPEIDFVVVSHNHYDHLDLGTLKRLAQRDPGTRFLVPLGNRPLLAGAGIENVTELNWGESVEIGETQVICLPAQHWSKRGLGDDQKALWSSWAVIGTKKRFYFAGDTGYFDGFRRIGEGLGPFDLASMPIGAYAPRAMMKASHMNPEEAIAAATDLKAKRAVAMHFGTFDLSDEPLTEPPARWSAAAAQTGFGDSELGQDAWVLGIGETRAF